MKNNILTALRSKAPGLAKGAATTAVKLVISLLIAVAALVAVCLMMDYGIGETLRTFFLNPLTSSYSRSEVAREMVPLIFTGVAVSLMVRCGQFNMFVEGAFFVGAFAAGVIAPLLPPSLPLIPLIAIIAATALSGAIGYIPAKMKASLGVSEFVSSLMLNYIVFWVCIYLLHGVCGDPDYINATRYLENYARLPFLNEDTELSSNIIIALLAAVVSAIFLFKSKWGYAIRMTGDNRAFAEYSGINAKGAVVYSQVIGSALAGAGGACFLLGNYYRFTWTELPNYGFDGFVIAIIAGNNPWAVPFAALFLAYLRVGALETSRLGTVPNEVVYIIQAIIIILFGAHILIKRVKKKSGKESANV